MAKELYGLKVLVVDDDQDTRDLLDWVLKRAGAESKTVVVHNWASELRQKTAKK